MWGTTRQEQDEWPAHGLCWLDGHLEARSMQISLCQITLVWVSYKSPLAPVPYAFMAHRTYVKEQKNSHTESDQQSI